MPLVSRSSFLLSALIIVPIAVAGTCGTRSAESAPPKSGFRNPLKPFGADPFMTYHKGYYYLTTTTGGDIKMRRAKRINDLKTAPDTVLWKDSTPGREQQMWAAEFHLLDGGNGSRWYCYYTASDGKDDNNHRMFVLESASDDIMGPYTFKAQLNTDPDNKFYAIDGSVIKTPRGNYMVWCGRPSAAGQGIYIARMSNPWTIIGPRTYLDVDGLGCKFVREGPVALYRNNTVFLTYSVCGASTPDYKLGMLSADVSADLTQMTSWKQFTKPVLARVDQHSVWGPGHNFFFKSPDGKQDWITFHAKTTMADTYGDRATWAQPITWRADGTPDFGLPVSADTDVSVPSGEPR